ncbi:MAG: hypothetical protein DDT38_01547 [Firmicutes bacterium]|nr:hypothetical protein [candidate division NPL-UPA2 bacterium]
MSLTPTVALRMELRWLVDERIPAGMTVADTRFSDVDLDILLTGATHINAAASAGWRIKASRAMSERGGLEGSQAGDEKHTFVSLINYRDHCLAMAQMYAQLTPRTGSRAMQYDLPEVSRRRG